MSILRHQVSNLTGCSFAKRSVLRIEMHLTGHSDTTLKTDQLLLDGTLKKTKKTTATTSSIYAFPRINLYIKLLVFTYI